MVLPGLRGPQPLFVYVGHRSRVTIAVARLCSPRREQDLQLYDARRQPTAVAPTAFAALIAICDARVRAAVLAGAPQA